MADTTTTNLGLTKPEVGASSDTWGNKLNTDLDLVDGVFAAGGTGTSVGLNIGAAKTLAVAGTINVTGSVTGGIVAPLASPTFTGTVVLPSTTSIGPVSSTEIGYLDGVTSAVQTQIDSKLAISTAASTYAPLVSPTFTGTVTLPYSTSIGGVSATEIVYLDGVTSNIQTQLDGKAALASPAFTGTPTAPTAVSGTNTTQVATTAFVQQVALNNQLPLQTGNTGKYLTTDGTDASWAIVPAEIPTQTGQSGKYLTTDGTDVSWGTVTIPAQVYPSAGIAVSTGTAWDTSLTAPSGAIVGTTDTQTLTNKTVEAGTFTNGYTEEVATANTSTAYTIDLAGGSVQILTLTGNCTFTFPTATAGRSFILILKQDGTGSRTATWPAAVKWPAGTAPTITSTASKADKYIFTADGTNWIGSNAGQNYTL